MTEVDKTKFLVPANIRFASFVHIIRNRLQMAPTLGLFVLTADGINPAGIQSVSDLYAKHRDEDGFLYLWYSGVPTMG